MPADRLSYDTGTSQQVQGDIQAVVGQLEALIGQRDSAVSAAMSDFQADGVSDEYAVVEQRWHRAATEVRQIVDLVKTTLVNNDESASSAGTRARNAVSSIG